MGGKAARERGQLIPVTAERAVKVRIGIVSWNTRDLLDRCLGALPEATDGLSADVVVVDNDSSDGSVEVVARHHGVKVVQNPSNIGYARAMNQALTDDPTGDHTDVFVALNPDTVPPAGSITALVERLLRTPDVGLVAPRLLNPDGTVQHSVYRFPSIRLAAIVGLVPVKWHHGLLGRRWWLEGGADHSLAGDVDWAIGAVHVIRSEALGAGPPYSERWFMYVEDLDLCWRLSQNGWRCRLEPDVTVVHVGNASGTIAWGDRRTGRWLDATYDWYRLRRGHSGARIWALINIVGVVNHLVGYVASALVRGGTPSRAEVAGRWRTLRHHWSGLVQSRSDGHTSALSQGVPRAPRTTV